MTDSFTHSDSFRITVQSLGAGDWGHSWQDGKRLKVQGRQWQLELMLPNDWHLIVRATIESSQPWLLIRILMPRPHLGPINSEFLWVEPGKLVFLKLSREFWCVARIGGHSPKSYVKLWFVIIGSWEKVIVVGLKKRDKKCVHTEKTF